MRMKNSQIEGIRNNTADLLAQVMCVKQSATPVQFIKFLTMLDPPSRAVARRFLNEMEEFPVKYE